MVSTAYGYLEVDTARKKGVFPVAQFVEKPQEEASKLIQNKIFFECRSFIYANTYQCFEGLLFGIYDSAKLALNQGIQTTVSRTRKVLVLVSQNQLIMQFLTL